MIFVGFTRRDNNYRDSDRGNRFDDRDRDRDRDDRRGFGGRRFEERDGFSRGRDNRDNRDSRDNRDNRESRDNRDSRDSRDNREDSESTNGNYYFQLINTIHLKKYCNFSRTP